MNPGSLRERVTIETPTETVDAYGQAVRTWTDAMSRWAYVAPLRLAQRVRADTPITQQLFEITMRMEPGFDYEQPLRVRWRTRTLEVVGARIDHERGLVTLEVRGEYGR